MKWWKHRFGTIELGCSIWVMGFPTWSPPDLPHCTPQGTRRLGPVLSRRWVAMDLSILCPKTCGFAIDFPIFSLVICEIAGFRETHHWHAIFSDIPGCFTLLSLQLHCYIFLLGKLRVELAKLTTAFSTSCDADPVEGVFWHGDGSDGTPIYCHG